MRRFPGLAVPLAALLICSGAVTASPLRAQENTSASSSQTTPIALIKPGDIVRLRIDREPEMSGDFAVDPAGIVVLPRIGEMMVLDETAETLEAKLLAEYRTFLRTPTIDVTVLRRVNITGSVGRPGVYNLDPTMTVDDALAMAGGVSPQGSRDDIQVFRDGAQLSTALGQQTAIGESIIRSGDQIYVPEKSWFSRNAPVVAAVISATAAIVIAAFISSN